MTNEGEPRDERVEELLRANEQLAAEVRNLTLGYSETPRPAGMPTSRRLARLLTERDRLQAELEATKADLGAKGAKLEEVSTHRAGLEAQNKELARELDLLSRGFGGVLRNLRARLILRAGGGAAPGPRER
jgi:DNA repair exonuclease SbcCD ATPase subunit